MTRPHQPSDARRQPRAAFSLVEILVVVAILAIIIYGLMMMFNQTQRALRAGMTQVDVLDAGRTAMEMMTRELEQIAPTRTPGVTNLYVRFGRLTSPLSVALPGGGSQNSSIQDIYFFSLAGDEWTATGYRVGPTNNDSMGTLYRFAVSNLNPVVALGDITACAALVPPQFPTNTIYRRVADGVMHLSLSVYDKEGRLITNSAPNVLVNLARGEFAFREDALPAYLELELGVVEPQVWERFNAIIDPTSWSSPAQLQRGREYLSRQAGRIHMFRQRIPVRTALR